MTKLILHEKYNRKDVHEIFDGGVYTKFTRGSGIWGLHGISSIRNRNHDYVFFVTIGQNKLGVEFKESISEDGILTWQSQKGQDLNDKRIIDFINHDHDKHNIYLFLRPNSKIEAFTYMGKLAYVSHDPTKEKPVHFKWQLLEWDETVEIEEISVENNKTDSVFEVTVKNQLIETGIPEKRERKTRTKSFDSSKVDYVEKAKKNKRLGLEGELLVLNFVKEILIQSGHQDLADKTVHTAEIEGDGAGYDIKTFKEDGTILYLEVKTTKGGINSEFYISPNELAFSEEHAEEYQLIRVYEYNSVFNNGKFYKIEGNLNETLKLKPTQYTARI